MNQGPPLNSPGLPPVARNQGFSLPSKAQPLSLPPRNPNSSLSPKYYSSNQAPRCHASNQSHPKTQGPSSRRSGPRVFKRQNSFAGFPSAALSIFSGAADSVNNRENVTDCTANHTVRVNKPENKYVNTIFTATGTASVQQVSHNQMSSIPVTQSTTNMQLNLIKGKRPQSNKVFYSLPRHATTSSNPALLKASASGLGLYFMSRNAANAKSSKKPSAAEQLGVTPAKFLSLPRHTKKKIQGEATVIKIPVYRSLPRPISRLKHSDAFSLPPSEINLQPGSNQIKLTRDPADGKEAEPKPRKPELENIISKRKEENKLESLITKENDPKYHPRSRTVVKNDTWVQPSLPKREDYINYPYKRFANEEYNYQLLSRPAAEKDAILYYYHHPPPYDKPNFQYKSFPRSEREIYAYHGMYRRPDGEEFTTPYQPMIRIPDVINYNRGSMNRPPLNPYVSSNYHHREYSARPYYPPFQPSVTKAPIENNMYSYHPPPPIISLGSNKPPEPMIPPQFNQPFIEDFKYQSLPKKTMRDVQPHYNSLPRQFGRENELRFYATNIDINEDPGYESLLKSVQPENVIKDTETSQSHNLEDSSTAFIMKDGKENEPRSETLTSDQDKILSLVMSPSSSLTFEPMYQTIPGNSPLDESGYSVLQAPPKKKDKHNDIKSSRKKEESKYQSLPRKSSRELDSKYQSLPRRKFKERDIEKPPLPKRLPREPIEGKYSNIRKLSKEIEFKQHHTTRRSSRDGNELRLSTSRKSDKSSPIGNRSASRKSQDPLPNEQQPPRSPRWIHPDTDEEDCMYTTVKSQQKDVDPVYQSVPEVAYTRPLPPVLAPSKYRRKSQDSEESGPPPLPPPRLTTGPVGSHNPLLNTTLPNTVSAVTMPLPSRPHIFRTPSSSLENINNNEKRPLPPFNINNQKEEEDPYSSIPSPISSSSPSLPKLQPQSRVASSASWDSLTASPGGSSGSKDISKKRRRAISDPRMDAGVLHRLAFTVWHTALHIEKEVLRS